MTTIAANKKCMAADRKVTDGDRVFKTHKIRRIGDAIVGGAGTSSAIAKFFRWMESGKQDSPPKLDKDDELEALVLTPAGLFTYGNDFTPDEVLDPFYAIGSGAHAALAAMHMKATPKRAVEIACKVDNSTDGPVDVLMLRKD
jgi:ATP-dependent protease HslVU (ClpYQ) peptidase subunit